MVRTGGSTILGGHDRPFGKGGPLARVGRLPHRAVHRAAQARDVSGGTSLACAGGGGVTRRAEHLFEERATLALGVARQQLVIEGVATDPQNPLLSELAGR